MLQKFKNRLSLKYQWINIAISNSKLLHLHSSAKEGSVMQHLNTICDSYLLTTSVETEQLRLVMQTQTTM